MTREPEAEHQTMLSRSSNRSDGLRRASGPGAGDEGFDLWMTASDEAPRKAELKAHSGVFRRPSTLIERLVFNSELERELFESGETVIVRVFLGEKPIRVFVVTNKILGLGAKLTLEARYVVKGRSDYQDTYTELA